MRHYYPIKLFATLACLLVSLTASYGQNQIQGAVSFITSENIYVRFESAEKVNIGDTLSIMQNGLSKPCLLVLSKSSTSCVTKSVNGCTPVKGTSIEATVQPEKDREGEKDKDTKPEESPSSDVPSTDEEGENEGLEEASKKSFEGTDISGRLSIANYGTSDVLGTKNRTVGRLAFDADEIGSSDFSFESYLNYTQLSTTRDVNADFRTSLFNVFNLALGYQKDSNYSIYLGRRINNNIASIGATDGVQAEKEFGKLSAGVLAGFRPDVFNYGLNFSLPQFGAYVAYKQQNTWVQSRTTLGFIEQRNSGAVDRRYAYWQHSSNFRKMFLFSSAQIDLYQKLSGQSQSDFKLSSFYLSARYQVHRKLSLMASFDTRKNLIFYESYANSLDFLTQNNPTRQGIRVRLNYRLAPLIYTGISYRVRTQTDNANTFNNYSAYIRHSKLPLVGGGLFLNYGGSVTESLTYSSVSARYNRGFFKNKMNFEAYYRMVSYQYTVAEFTLPAQHFFGGGFGYNITSKTTLSALFEHTTRDTYTANRLNLKLIQRF